MTSVEREMEYVNIKPEASLESTKDLKPSDHWPKYGEIIANDINMKYSEHSNLILRNINFKISPREKVYKIVVNY